MGTHQLLSCGSQSFKMPPFRSTLEDPEKNIALVAILPLRQTTKGGDRGVGGVTSEEDIVDQALDRFKANILFKQFELETTVDRVLVYVTLYIVECLKRLAKASNKGPGLQDMQAMALESWPLPGEPGFPLNAFYGKSKGGEVAELKNYLTQIRQETGARLAERVFAPELASQGGPSKFWTCWAKRKFLNVSLAKKF